MENSDFNLFTDDHDTGHTLPDTPDKKRSRTWMLLLYPDYELHKPFFDFRLDELGIDYAGRAHDAEPSAKLHHHVVLCFQDQQTVSPLSQKLGIEKRWLRPWDSKKKAFRYLCHKDHPQKVQYDPSGIYGPLTDKAIAECNRGSKESEEEQLQKILECLSAKEDFVSYSSFFSEMLSIKCFSAFRRLGSLGIRLIDEHNGAFQKQFENTVSRETALIGLKQSIASDHSLTFDERCALLERLGFPSKEGL